MPFTHQYSYTEMQHQRRLEAESATHQVFSYKKKNTGILTPFGSSINSFGRFDCDLNMVLELESEEPKEGNTREGSTYFLSKLRLENERQHTQQCLDTIAGILRHFMPHFQHVRHILNACVPIVKFRHAGCEVECDLCLSNRSALYMSELLYTYGQLDLRVCPLVFTIRHWARANQITHSGPGPWISNFTLTLLVLHHLQTTGVVPPLNTLRSLADSTEQKAVDDIDCSFTSDVPQVPAGCNTQSLDELLKSFLEFYTKFDFGKHAISLVSGKTFSKPENSPLYLENPIETELNVSKNVMETNLANFQQGCQEALELLNSCLGCSLQHPWGLMSVLKTATTNEEEKKLNTQILGIFDDVSEEDKTGDGNGDDKFTEQRSEGHH
ncbi:Poly(A) RNA polymerase, mitochondrial [Lamellibrachia satsuma]|nr:Poly(A) RNA polymerase, mitochondrial [Lamellibrachia satsuma]